MSSIDFFHPHNPRRTSFNKFYMLHSCETLVDKISAITGFLFIIQSSLSCSMNIVLICIIYILKVCIAYSRQLLLLNYYYIFPPLCWSQMAFGQARNVYGTEYVNRYMLVITVSLPLPGISAGAVPSHT